MLPSEILTVASLASFVALALAGSPPSPVPALGLAALAGATVALARRQAPGAFARTWFAVVTVVVTFSLLEPVIVGVNPRTFDARLAALDARWFAPVLEAWRGALGRPPAFTDLVHVAYVSYYFLPLLAVALAWARGPDALERTTFALLLAFYATYAGYLLLPAAGPRLPLAEEAAVIGGGAVSEAVRAFLHAAEKTRLDAFPSGHTAVALLSAWAAGRSAPRLALPVLAWAALVVFSTVYIHVHYVVDVVAGAALAGAVVLCAEPLRRALEVAAASVTRRLAGTPPRAEGA